MTTATKDAPSTRHTECVCPVCGAPAGYDLAPNPGPAAGGEHAPPFPPPEGVNPGPEPPEPEHGPWYLVLCTTGAHRFLCPESRLDMLELPPPPEGGGLAAIVSGPADRMRGVPGPAPKKHQPEHEPGKPAPHPAPPHPATHEKK